VGAKGEDSLGRAGVGGYNQWPKRKGGVGKGGEGKKGKERKGEKGEERRGGRPGGGGGILLVWGNQSSFSRRNLLSISIARALWGEEKGRGGEGGLSTQ